MEQIHQRKAIIDEIIGEQTHLIEIGDEDYLPQDLLILGQAYAKRWGIVLNIDLTKRERRLLEQLATQWTTTDQDVSNLSFERQLTNWIIKHLKENSSTPVPQSIQIGMNWRAGWRPIGFTLHPRYLEAAKSGGQSLIELHELLDNYLPKPTIILELTESFILCLVFENRITEDRDPEGIEQERKEWMAGLYDLCQNECSERVQVLYHLPLYSPEELILRARDLWSHYEVMQWSVPYDQPIAPWDSLIEQVITQLSDEEQERLLHLYQPYGSFSIMEEKDWVMTLSIFFKSNLNIALAAKQLYVHRNTLIYRLDRITTETGLDPRSFKDAVLLQIYLLLRQKQRFDHNNQR